VKQEGSDRGAATVAAQITAEQLEAASLASLQTINSVAADLLGETTLEGVCTVVAHAARTLFPDAYVAVTHLTADGERFDTVQFLGLQGSIDATCRLVGDDPLSWQYRIAEVPEDAMAAYTDSRLHRLEGGLHELGLGKLPKRFSRPVEKLLGVVAEYAIGFPWQGRYYGGLSLMVPPGCAVEPHTDVIETLAHLATLALWRALSEQHLTVSEERYRGIFENAVLGLYRSTPKGRLESVNPAYARIYGYDSPEQMVAEVQDLGKQAYVRLEDREEYRRRLEDSSDLIDYEMEQVRRDGARIWVRGSTVAVRDEDGELLFCEGSLEDVTAST
jgi:PAS domain S-box-containing protein